MISKVTIVGGTHGNEFTGVYVVKRARAQAQLFKRESFEYATLLANPRAFEAGRRYIDQDLNRCFSIEQLRHPNVTAKPSHREIAHHASYEKQRAVEIYKQLVESPSPTDFIIDIHSTTANMGITIIPSSDATFNLKLSAYISSINPDVKTYAWSGQGQERNFLRSICPLGCTVEVGPIAPGVANTAMIQKTESVIGQILDYIEAENQGQLYPTPQHLKLYRGIKTVDFPRDKSGQITATVHPDLQGKDYLPLSTGMPMFLTFQNTIIPYSEPSAVYPVFINEAAYYEKGIAMCLTQPEDISF